MGYEQTVQKVKEVQIGHTSQNGPNGQKGQNGQNVLEVLVLLIIHVGPKISAFVQQTKQRAKFSGIFSYKSLKRVAQLLKVSDLISF